MDVGPSDQVEEHGRRLRRILDRTHAAFGDAVAKQSLERLRESVSGHRLSACVLVKDGGVGRCVQGEQEAPNWR